MKITLTAETDAERTQSPIPVEIPGMRVLAIVGLRHDEGTGLDLPEERYMSALPLGFPLLVGMLGVLQARIQDIVTQPPKPSQIQRPIVVPNLNGVPRM